MKTVTSADGTRIAYDELGSGPPVILCCGAFSYREFPSAVKLAELLAKDFTVLNYDRRGRGDSTDTKPYAIEREIEDIAALIEAAGGAASIWGWSSGAVLALRAGAVGLGLERVSAYDPPFVFDPDARRPPADAGARLEEMVAAGDRGGAAWYMLTKVMGVPVPFVAGMRIARPMWGRLKATAHTLPYDYALCADEMRGRPPNAEPWESIDIPVQVMAGEKSGPLKAPAKTIAEAIPTATYTELEGSGHNLKVELLASAVTPFLAGAGGQPGSSPGGRGFKSHPRY
jgi:pimeloyl-ACP methyl ester carboxylesterase